MSDVDFAKMFNIKTPAKLDTNQTILVVEDQQDMRLIVVHQLQKLTFTKVKQASNGMEALEVMAEEKNSISVIICDMEMPTMGGLDLLGELRERTDLTRPPFCLSMDNVSKEKLMLAVENGTDEILVKPFTLSDISPKVHTAFKIYHNPKNPEKVYELAKTLLREKKLDESLKVYQALAASAEKSARPWVGMARVALGRKDTAGALKFLQDAEDRNKNYVHLYSVRGDVFVAESKWDEALASYKEAIRLSPLNPMRYKYAADLLFKVKKYKEAIELLESAVKQGLEFKGLYHYLSQGCFALKDFKGAMRYVRSALNGDPDNVVYLNQLGICLKEQQQFDEAQKVYNQIIKLEPENIPALYNKAILINTKGDNAEAVKILERILKKDPTFEPAKVKLEEYSKKAAAPKAS